MPNIDDDIRKAGKRLKALRKTASAHNKANRIFVYKRDGRDVSEDALRLPSKRGTRLPSKRGIRLPSKEYPPSE